MARIRRHVARWLWDLAFLVSPDEPITITTSWVGRLADDGLYREVFIDRDLSNWHGADG